MTRWVWGRWGSGWRQRLFNSVYRIDAAAPLQAYDKRALVPFAEYWPGPLSVRPKWLEAAAVTPGTQPALFNAGGCRLGMLICFEAERPDLAREAVRSGADALLVVSNDADLPLPAVRREIAQARLRAVETGVPVVRAANRGISVVIDRYGRVLQDGSGKVLHAAISPGRPALAVNIQPLLLALFWITTGSAILHRLLRLRRLC
ncbi:MAG: nitrilase-related carbon-nitrogen hydrolase [Candidatus Binatia bacterium]